MNITVLNFSPRTNGNCAQICSLIQEHHVNANIRLFSVCDHVLPCSSCNYECLEAGVGCPQLTHEYVTMMDALCNSDLAYYVVPNFCGMPNSIYYAFNERSVGYFNLDEEVLERYLNVKKRFIVVSNSENDTFTESLRQQTKEDPEILYLKTSRYGKRSIAGDLMESQEARADLKGFLTMNLITDSIIP